MDLIRIIIYKDFNDDCENCDKCQPLAKYDHFL